MKFQNRCFFAAVTIVAALVSNFQSVSGEGPEAFDGRGELDHFDGSGITDSGEMFDGDDAFDRFDEDNLDSSNVMYPSATYVSYLSPSYETPTFGPSAYRKSLRHKP